MQNPLYFAYINVYEILNSTQIRKLTYSWNFQRRFVPDDFLLNNVAYTRFASVQSSDNIQAFYRISSATC